MTLHFWCADSSRDPDLQPAPPPSPAGSRPGADGAGSGDPGSCGPGNGCEGWKLTVTFEGHGTVADQCVDAGCSCAPLELTFTGIVFTDQRAECDRGVQIMVTE